MIIDGNFKCPDRTRCNSRIVARSSEDLGIVSDSTIIRADSVLELAQEHTIVRPSTGQASDVVLPLSWYRTESRFSTTSVNSERCNVAPNNACDRKDTRFLWPFAERARGTLDRQELKYRASRAQSERSSKAGEPARAARGEREEQSERDRGAVRRKRDREADGRVGVVGRVVLVVHLALALSFSLFPSPSLFPLCLSRFFSPSSSPSSRRIGRKRETKRRRERTPFVLARLPFFPARTVDRHVATSRLFYTHLHARTW